MSPDLLTLDSNPVVPCKLIEIGDEGCWSLSSSKLGNGVMQLRDGNIDTFWQSDGVGPHTVTVQFNRKVKICRVDFYMNYKIDDSYTPQLLTIRLGNNEADLEDVLEVNLHEPVGWRSVELSTKELLEGLPTPIDTIDTETFSSQCSEYLSAFCLQIAITQNHQSGRDSHVRQIRIYGPRRPAPNEMANAHSPCLSLSRRIPTIEAFSPSAANPFQSDMSWSASRRSSADLRRGRLTNNRNGSAVR